MRLPYLVVVVVILLCASRRVEAACTVSTPGESFGNYDVFSAGANTSTGTITFHCNGSDRDIVITISKGSSTTFAPRTLKNGTEVLQYNLYRDAAFSTVWGDGTAGTGTYTIRNPPNNQDVNLTVFGRVPALQDVAVGSYSDTVIVTINF